MQVRCNSCSRMVEAPPGWSGSAFTCGLCGGTVSLRRTCPYCAEDIHVLAQRCEHCDEVLDERLRAQEQRGWLDRQIVDSSIVLLLLLSVCLNGLALVLGIVGWVACKDPEAKRRARLVTLVAGTITLLAILLQVIAAAAAGRY